MCEEIDFTGGGDAAYSAAVAYGYEGRVRRPYLSFYRMCSGPACRALDFSHLHFLAAGGDVQARLRLPGLHCGPGILRPAKADFSQSATIST